MPRCSLKSSDTIRLSEYDVVWHEGDRLPELTVTIPLEQGEDFTLGSAELRLDRSNTSAEDVLVKSVSPTDSEPNYHVQFVFTWDAGDLLEACGQFATIDILNAGGLRETVLRLEIDVLGKP